MIARWQRILLLCILLATASWLVWQWPHSPWHAVLGALVPLGIYLVVMALEFVLMHITNRTEPDLRGQRDVGYPLPLRIRHERRRAAPGWNAA